MTSSSWDLLKGIVTVLSKGVMVSSYDESFTPRTKTSKVTSSEPIFESIRYLGNVIINSPLARASSKIFRDAVSESISKSKTSPPRIL